MLPSSACLQTYWVGPDPGQNSIDIIRFISVGLTGIAYLLHADRTERMLACPPS